MDWKLEPAELEAIQEEFRSNSLELLRVMSTQLLRLERNPNDHVPVREMFLCAHTIKGGAAMLDFAPLRDVMHAMEDVLVTLRDEIRRLDARLADMLFHGFDLVRDLLSGTGDAATMYTACDNVIASLRGWIGNQADQGTTGERPVALLVEESSTVRGMEAMLLLDAGLQVDTAVDGRQALAMARTKQYKMIITGTETRGLRGVDLATALRGLPATAAVPIILLSSEPSPEFQKHANAAGVDIVVARGSFRYQPLLSVVQALMKRTK